MVFVRGVNMKSLGGTTNECLSCSAFGKGNFTMTKKGLKAFLKELEKGLNDEE